MKKNYLFSLFAMLFVALSFTACNDDDDNKKGSENEEEEITSVVITINGTAYTYKEGTTPTIELEANKTYNATIGFFNGDEVVTTEIKEESDEHLICYTPSSANVTIARTDKDANDKEIGLTTTWTTGAVSTGTLNVMLKHQPDLKANQSTENCSIGGTDVDANFKLTVK